MNLWRSSLQPLIRFLLSQAVMAAVAVAAMAAAVSFVYLDNQAPQYEARARVLVGTLAADFEEIRAAQALVPTYVELASSDALLARAVTDANLDIRTRDLRRMLTVVSVGTSRVILISARHEDANLTVAAVGAVSGALAQWDSPSEANITILDAGSDARAIPDRTPGLVVLAAAGGAGLAVGTHLLMARRRETLP